MSNNYYLATTGLSELWDTQDGVLLLGPWCTTDKANIEILKGVQSALAPSPWKPAGKIEAATDYCQSVYEQLLPALQARLNAVHGVDYPEKYWRILVGPWLLHYVGVLYDRYARVQHALKTFPDLHTNVLPAGKCRLATLDIYDYFDKISGPDADRYNLRILSLVCAELCHSYPVEGDYALKEKPRKHSTNWKHRLYNWTLRLPEAFSNSGLVLSNMVHLRPHEALLLQLRAGLGGLRFINFERGLDSPAPAYSDELREGIRLDAPEGGGFLSLLYGSIPHAMPMSYLENFNALRQRSASVKNTRGVRMVGSSEGWCLNEGFKFFAARAAADGALTAEFQHGGGYEILRNSTIETICKEKDLMYTWGQKEREKDRPLPSPHLSRLMDTHHPTLNDALMVGTVHHRYHYRFQSYLQPEDFGKYYDDKGVFLGGLKDSGVRLLYRPYPAAYESTEVEKVRGFYPKVGLAQEGSLVGWMQRAKIVVIDHPSTSWVEAMAIDVPCVFFWDHDVFLLRPAVDERLERLRSAGILFRDPARAAEKVREVFDNPHKWWHSDEVQEIRRDFLGTFGLAGRDWMSQWLDEFKAASRRAKSGLSG